MTKKIYIETYGCQMNFSDSEIIASVMEQEDYKLTGDSLQADVILVNTCSIRDNAEQRVFGRMRQLSHLKARNPGLVIGIVGCMAERLKDDLLRKFRSVDLIAGPDAYRSLPEMLSTLEAGRQVSNVILSSEETYDQIEPVRLDPKGVSAFISIMRGCDNYCAYCVVPYTRGRERSRSPQTIIKEARALYAQGYREITLLGQNVNSYKWQENGELLDFPELLKQVSLVHENLRIRFATSHPKDISDKLISTIAKRKNIARSIHLPVQSGSTAVLKRMNRKYTRQWYLERIKAVKNLIPDCGITTDLIAGFCGETDQEFQQTLSLMEEVGYDFAFMFKYSQRAGTYAADHLRDDVPEAVKARRLQLVINFQQRLSEQSNRADVGKTFSVLVEGPSRKDEQMMMGRNEQNKVIVFPGRRELIKKYVDVVVKDYTSATLLGEVVDA
ncbi:MAG: tRNA (N6-isopentenyl adenosine(37)-C2)-methylthiotransferase MiaB [Bacteroidales bacterium]